MRIATRLKLAAWVPAFMALVIGLALLFSYGRMERSLEEGKTARQIMHGMNELNNFVRSYMLYREDRPKSQFLMGHDSVTGLFATLRFDSTEEQQILESIRHNSESMKDAFLKLVSHYEAQGSVATAALLKEAEERLAGRILTKARDVISDALRLESVIHQEISTTGRRMSALVIFLIAATTFPLTVALIRTMRSINRSLAALRKGTEIIAAGNLNHRIAMAAQDEIGDVSLAFDLMTEQLRKTTVSRDELSVEVEERKRVEAALRQNREWLRVTLSSIGDAVLATDTAGRISFLNPVAEALTGWKLDEALGKPIQSVFRIINEKTHEPAEDIVARVLREGRVVALANHTALLNREGREIPIEDSAAPIRDKTGNMSGVVLVFHDVTEKRRAQEALRESENKLRIVADFTYDWEYWRSPDDRFLYVSPSCERVTGYSREALMRDPGLYGRIIHPEDRDRIMAHMREDQLHQESCELEFRIVDRDGRQRWIAHACQPALDEHGKSLGRRCSNRDITERKQAEEALRKAHGELDLRVRERTAELARANKALQDFVFIAAHDLQEPLRKIVTFGGILTKRFQDPLGEKGKAHLARMTREASRMSALLRSLLGYSRLFSLAGPFKPTDLTRIVRDVVRDFELTITDLGGEVEVGELPTIEADSDQMRLLFMNLIQNSLKYRRGYANPRIKIQGEAGAESCRIVVQDNGIGFEQQYAEKIFTPFQRLHGRESGYEGTGMGLAVCRKIVELHGGEIWAEGSPGEGATFNVILPIRQSQGGMTA
jgi:PAS domain S-box-containing protein